MMKMQWTVESPTGENSKAFIIYTTITLKRARRGRPRNRVAFFIIINYRNLSVSWNIETIIFHYKITSNIHILYFCKIFFVYERNVIP